MLLFSAIYIVLPPIIVSMSYSHDNHNLLLLYVKNVTATGATGNSERGTCKSFNCARYLFFLSPCLRGVRASETVQNCHLQIEDSLRHVQKSVSLKRAVCDEQRAFLCHDKRERAGSCSCIHRQSHRKLHHTRHVPLTFLFFFRCSMSQSESALDITSQPGCGLSPLYLA